MKKIFLYSKFVLKNTPLDMLKILPLTIRFHVVISDFTSGKNTKIMVSISVLFLKQKSGLLQW